MDEDELIEEDPVRLAPTVGGNAMADHEIEESISHLRGYLKQRLIQNKLATDWKESDRVRTFNGKVKPEGIPEHNDPYRIDWTELEKHQCFVGTDVRP
jgi:actin-related protein 8